MKSKAPLVMMEQMVMILVFALAAALCLQAFVLSDNLSRENERRDQAVVLCQNLVEEAQADAYRVRDAYPGMVEDSSMPDVLTFHYDENGQQAEEPSVYRVEVEPLDVAEELKDSLGKAAIRVYDEASGKELYRLEFAWQGRGLKG